MYDIIVVGDVHGDLNVLLQPLRLYLDNIKNNKPTKLIFLGDYIDRGHQSTYIYLIIRNILSSKKSIFKDIIFLRGNHECIAGLTVDNYRVRNDNRNDNRYYIKSYLFDHFYHLPLKPYYYDSNYNIMFSHAKLMRNVNLLRGIKEMDLYDISIGMYDDRGICFTDSYLNIHGHDHHGIEPTIVQSTVDKHLLTHSSKACISIDYDCSYGFQYLFSLVNGIVDDSNSGTQLAYLYITPACSTMIPGDTTNYNRMRFNTIMKLFPEISSEMKYTLDDLWRWLLSVEPGMSVSFLNQLFMRNLRCRINTTCTYYDDIPIEFFEKMNDYRFVPSDNPYQRLIVGKCLFGDRCETFTSYENQRSPVNIVTLIVLIMSICIGIITVIVFCFILRNVSPIITSNVPNLIESK